MIAGVRGTTPVFSAIRLLPAARSLLHPLAALLLVGDDGELPVLGEGGFGLLPAADAVLGPRLGLGGGRRSVGVRDAALRRRVRLDVAAGQGQGDERRDQGAHGQLRESGWGPRGASHREAAGGFASPRLATSGPPTYNIN